MKSVGVWEDGSEARAATLHFLPSAFSLCLGVSVVYQKG
jgi:hypothetical protein